MLTPASRAKPEKPPPTNAGDSAIHQTLSPVSRAESLINRVILGLAPQALCLRLLRRLKPENQYLLRGLNLKHARLFPCRIQDVHLAETGDGAPVAHGV